MEALSTDLHHLRIHVDLEDFQKQAIVPWFSFRVRLPRQPLPPIAERPHVTTERLIVRPFQPTDVDALWDNLRSRPELQVHSRFRGRADPSKEDTQRAIEALTENPDAQWYFGAFLRSTGELVAEGGLPDCETMSTSLSGWPEAEILVKPEYWRQGYGTEFFGAVMNSWWALPRETRRVQLLPVATQGMEPGSRAVDGVVFQWENGNEAAELFVGKVLANNPVFVSGTATSFDQRAGREGEVVTWAGLLAVNPNAPSPDKDDESDEDGADSP